MITAARVGYASEAGVESSGLHARGHGSISQESGHYRTVRGRRVRRWRGVYVSQTRHVQRLQTLGGRSGRTLHPYLVEFNEKMQGRFTDSRSGSVRFWKGFRLKHEIDPVMAETGNSYEGLEKAIQ